MLKNTAIMAATLLVVLVVYNKYVKGALSIS